MTAPISTLSQAADPSKWAEGAINSTATTLFNNLDESGYFAHGRVKQLALALTLVVSAITAAVLVCLLPISLALLLTLPTLILGLFVTALIQRERTYLFADRNVNNDNHFSLLTKDIKGSWKSFFAYPYVDDEQRVGYLRQAPLIFVEKMIYPEKGLSRPDYGRSGEMLNFHKVFCKASAIAFVVFSRYASNTDFFAEERVRIEQHTIIPGWRFIEEHHTSYSSKPYEVIHIGSDQNELNETQKASLKKILDAASHPLFFI